MSNYSCGYVYYCRRFGGERRALFRLPGRRHRPCTAVQAGKKASRSPFLAGRAPACSACTLLRAAGRACGLGGCTLQSYAADLQRPEVAFIICVIAKKLARGPRIRTAASFSSRKRSLPPPSRLRRSGPQRSRTCPYSRTCEHTRHDRACCCAGHCHHRLRAACMHVYAGY